MKAFVVSFISLLLCTIGSADEVTTATGKCTLGPATIPDAWRTMVSPCIIAMKNQVQTELKAAITYMSMGAYFSQDTVNRPGFTKMFFESASEEREHAIKILKYLIMRGELLDSLKGLIKRETIFKVKEKWASGAKALEDALNLETEVTKSITEIIKECEHSKVGENAKHFNDYHLVDYLTGEFLEEQLKGEEDLAKKLSTLGKLTTTYGELGEFLFDKKLLNGEPL